jgi:hypothetical protein
VYVPVHYWKLKIVAGHCCQVPERVVCKFWTKIRPNVKKICIFSKICFYSYEWYKISIKRSCLEILTQKLYWQLLTKANKSWDNSYFSYNIFLGHFCPKSAAVRPPNFPGQSFFYSAGIVLFGRIFGRLAIVLQDHQKFHILEFSNFMLLEPEHIVKLLAWKLHMLLFRRTHAISSWQSWLPTVPFYWLTCSAFKFFFHD